MFKEGYNAYVLDIEADNLYPFQKNTWTIRIKRVGADDWLRINPFKLSKEETKRLVTDFIFREEKPIIIGHNYAGYDGWVLWKDFDIEMHFGKDTMNGKEVIYFDTLYASQYFLPDREGGHSLKSWGIRVGDNKIDFRQICIDLGIIEKGALSLPSHLSLGFSNHPFKTPNLFLRERNLTIFLGSSPSNSKRLGHILPFS